MTATMSQVIASGRRSKSSARISAILAGSARVALFILLVLLLPKIASSQGSLYQNIAWKFNPAGAFPAGGATITICTSTATGAPCTPTVTVFSDSALSSPVTNPLPQCTVSPQFGCIDNLGNFSFYATPGVYTYTVSGAGLTAYGPIPAGLPCVVGVSCVALNSNVTFKSINNVQYADQQTGVDACAKITAAEALLPVGGGGVVDARGFQGVQTACAGGFAVGSTTKPVQLLISGAVFQVQSPVTIFTGSEIKGTSPNSATNVTSAIRAVGTYAGGALIQEQNSGGSGAIHLRDIQVQCQGLAGCIGIDLGVNQDLTTVQGVLILNWVSGCIVATNAQVQQVELDSVFCLGSTVTGAGVVGIDLGAPAGLNDNFKLTNVSVTTQSATPMLADIRCNSCNMHGDAIHVENGVDGILFTGANSGTSAVDTISGLINITNVIHIAANWNGGLIASAIRKINATTAVKNDIAAFSDSCNDESVGTYILSSQSSSPQQRITTCSTQNSSLRGIPIQIASGTIAMGTTITNSGACANAAAVSATGVATTDRVIWSGNNSPAAGNQGLTVWAWPTVNNVNFAWCNPTAGNITPAAATLNWAVVR